MWKIGPESYRIQSRIANYATLTYVYLVVTSTVCKANVNQIFVIVEPLKLHVACIK
jgi:hypothetical protein